MNKDIMRQAGFEKEVKMVENGICPTCYKLIIMSDDPSTFKDQLSYKEFTISGMCQQCQDDIFGV